MTDIGERANAEGRARLAIGVLQGVALYVLFDRLKPAAGEPVGPWLAAARAAAGLGPFVLLGGLGAMRPARLGLWSAAAALGLGAIAAYAALTNGTERTSGDAWPLFVSAMAVVLFVAHHLVVPADQERRWRAAYTRYFDVGWTDGVRLVLSAGFVLALWALLYLGASLFDLIGIDAPREIITKAWFIYPVTATAFAAGVNLTDIRASLVKGVRTVALTLLSWLLPLMAVIAAAFLAALPFTGLQPLWETRSAAGVLLAAAAALIILVNAAYQDGQRDDTPAALRWAGRLGAAIVAPLVGIAAYAVGLRVDQYGLTPGRVVAIACVVVGVAFAVGYITAAASRRAWLKRLEDANVLTAFLIVVVMLALMSPIADPRRLSVNDQIHRLDVGAVTPAEFDYDFLRFRAGRAGETALKALARRRGGVTSTEIARRAKEALAKTTPYDQPPPPRPRDRAALVTVAKGAALPASFLDQDWAADQDPFRNCTGPKNAANRCMAVVGDFNGDGEIDVAFLAPGARNVFSRVAGRWTVAAQVWGETCPGDVAAVEAGRVALAPPLQAWVDLEIDGRRQAIGPVFQCPPVERPQAPRDAPDMGLVKPPLPAN